MPAVMAIDSISRGILKQRRRKHVVPWLCRELITERRIQPPDTVTDVRVNAVRHPKTTSKRESELLEHVARSIAFEIPRNHTDRAVYGYCRLQRGRMSLMCITQ